MFKVSYALEKGRAKSHVYYLDLLAHPLGGF